MRIKRISTNQINPAPYNPRKDLKPGDPDYDKLRRSIEEFGCVEPLVWNKRSGNLVGGHQRLKVLIEQGAIEVDVSVVDLPPEKEKALNIALNRISGDWDPLKLAQLLDELVAVPDFDVELTGFDLTDVNALIAESLQPSAVDGEDNFDVEAELEANRPLVTQQGDLIELRTIDSDPRFRGHRLLCGDCTDPEHVKRLMRGDRAILFATDPPYLVGYDGTNHPGKSKLKERIKNKDWSNSYAITWDDAEANSDLYENFIRVAIDEAIDINAAWYCWHASRRQAMVEAVWEQFGAFVHQQIIWVKDRPILTRSWYTWQHEPCFFGWVRPHKPTRRSKDYPSSIWHIPTIRIGQVTEHPTSKPLEVFRIPLHQHTRAGELCYEPFAGSGSQIIAAEQLGRRCNAIEISPRYCDVIVRRFIAFVGKRNIDPELAERYSVPDQDAKQVIKKVGQ
ncbi:MAG: DNA modification methylase [Planctomycetes bacterium]|nr:DNA modification methylase [Planctomycetota bacterium]